MSHQHSLPLDFTGTVCDEDFDILSFRYLRHKDGSIIRYRNFELSYDELLERRETLGYRDRSRTGGLSEKEFDLKALMKAQLSYVLRIWDSVIDKAEVEIRRSKRSIDQSYAVVFSETLFTDKLSPCRCSLCTRTTEAVTYVRENAVAYHSKVTIHMFRDIFSDVDWSDVPQILT
ncbi:hypothetical protein EXIGLDRAFT_475306 [Exidia glandulosa HHB12029]|uniref:Uncharacterized protein n=1 Tax=Exidia glandulosa HHB12029 TaxID=1314781 RepID=A0A166NLF7_EXIGL|nr:hypothetical protein EXIGLDRAFT_475306 [Exidia glandulosa HHB12029]